MSFTTFHVGTGRLGNLSGGLMSDYRRSFDGVHQGATTAPMSSSSYREKPCRLTIAVRARTHSRRNVTPIARIADLGARIPLVKRAARARDA